jgi:16S rRNA processing protein RimM
VGELLLIGKLAAASGIKGELKLYHYSGDRENLKGLSELYVENVSYKAELIRFASKVAIIRLDGVETRNDAELLVGREVYIEADSLPPLPDDSFYVRDLIGMDVYDFGGRGIGEFVGVVKDIIDNPAHDILLITDVNDKEYMLPLVDAFVLDIDEERRIIKANIPDGLRVL